MRESRSRKASDRRVPAARWSSAPGANVDAAWRFGPRDSDAEDRDSKSDRVPPLLLGGTRSEYRPALMSPAGSSLNALAI